MKRYDLYGATLGLLGLLLAFFGAFLFCPVSFMLRRAFGAGGEFTLQYFGQLLDSPLQRESLWNSLPIALLTIGLTMVVQSLAQRWFFTVLPTDWTLAHYTEVLGRGLTASSIRHSLFYASLSAGWTWGWVC